MHDNQHPSFSKPMIIMLILLALLFGGVLAYNFWNTYRTQHLNQKIHSIFVSAMRASKESWQSEITAVGNLDAINGVDVTTEIAGLIQEVKINQSQDVQKGEILVQLNADAEIAQLHALQAQVELAKLTYERDKKQFAIQGISKANLEIDEADLKNKKALLEQQKAIVAKKTIRAPFNGRFGVSIANAGQYLNPGDTVGSLQALNPLYIYFLLPQQELPHIKVTQPVTIITDVYPHDVFEGKITSIDSKVDHTTRNVLVEATLQNPEYKILPGMYGVVSIKIGSPQFYLTLPQAAISYNSYGDMVYILTPEGKDEKGKPLYKATQKFVVLGKKRVNQVQILKGIKEEDLVVTGGQLKLKNGSIVSINNDNALLPTNTLNPHLENKTPSKLKSHHPLDAQSPKYLKKRDVIDPCPNTEDEKTEIQKKPTESKEDK